MTRSAKTGRKAGAKAKKRKTLSKEERAQRAREQALHRKVLSWLKNLGFIYLPTAHKTKHFGLRDIELDGVYLFENIIIFCEETTSTSEKTDHLLKKQEAANEINAHFSEVLDWLRNDFPDKLESCETYAIQRYRKIHLYITSEVIDDNLERFKPLVIMPPETLQYFSLTAGTIKRSARFEFFKFLGLEREDIGLPSSGTENRTINTSIICPEDNAGLPNGVRLVSFMMKPEDLLECGYVLRLDNWEDQTEKYQRLLDRKRVNEIRSFIATQKQTFVNNTIVGLPGDVSFTNADGEAVTLNDIQDFRSCSMHIPKRMNSIRIIDGQHRIYAHYEGDDQLEGQISGLRKKLHLLVTGFVYPENLGDAARASFESSMFATINSKAKPVKQSVLLYIESWQYRFSDQGVARQTLVKLNGNGRVFAGLLRLSEMSNAKIKTPSIIKFALRRLVRIDDASDVSTLFHYWDGDQDLLQTGDRSERTVEDALEAYLEFVTSKLDIYFSAVRSAKADEWKDEASKILSTISINGFLLALHKTLPVLGLRDFNFYCERFKRLDVSFKRGAPADGGFPFTASQYNMFSELIVRECFPEVLAGNAPAGT